MNRLKERDRIDPLQGGLLNLMERIVGGKLFHCRYCRVQFYDRRLLASEVAVAGAPEAPAASSQVTTPPDTANSDK
ncbi:MAG TPA: hypothetical protein VG675_17340 [Bryobacteraceae bacterium]|nr:hypothetical protein [Bryobacteraceae bacterium]